MFIYKVSGCEELQDCDTTVAFLQRVHQAIVAMTARRSYNALAPNNENYSVR